MIISYIALVASLWAIALSIWAWRRSQPGAEECDSQELVRLRLEVKHLKQEQNRQHRQTGLLAESLRCLQDAVEAQAGINATQHNFNETVRR